MFALYVDLEEAEVLDTSTSYEVGGARAAKDLNSAAIRQSTSTGASCTPTRS